MRKTTKNIAASTMTGITTTTMTKANANDDEEEESRFVGGIIGKKQVSVVTKAESKKKSKTKAAKKR
jgi:hypothetical protein